MKTLMSYLPENYENSEDSRTIQEAIQPETEMLWQARDEMLEQLDPDTATWGLKYWEAAFGIPVDESKELDYRRTRVKSKIRGTGTVTKEMVQNVSESFSHGEVEVTEYPGESRLEIRFVSRVGRPPNLDDLEDTLLEIIPAHLAFEFIVSYRTHIELSSYTHGELAAYSHKTLYEEEMI